MSTLTISQVQKVLQISYPTALDFAQRYGSQLDGRKWFVPATAVEAVVKRREAEVAEMQRRLKQELAK